LYLEEVDVTELLKVNKKEVRVESAENFNGKRIKELEEAVVSLRETLDK
jgi:hypothetical protein